MRLPSLRHTLQVVKQIAPSTLNTIIDIGAQRETGFLIHECGDAFHHLFEPVGLYHPDLEKKYQQAGIQYSLHPVALSDVDGEAYLHNYSEIEGAAVTHSYLSFEASIEHSGKHVSTEKVKVQTLCSALRDCGLADYEYLVKLDVDGHEENIVAGGKEVLQKASFVIIEASLGRRNVIQRIELIEALGFRLFDIADHGYYFGQMSQCDLVFINEYVRSSHIEFRPWEMTDYIVRWNRWQHGLPELENTPLDFDKN